MEKETLAAFLPDFFGPAINAGKFVPGRIPDIEKHQFHYRLAWNPRLLRLNRHAILMRDSLLRELQQQPTSGASMITVNFLPVVSRTQENP